MEQETLLAVLGWCGVINILILLWWFGFMWFAKDWVYNMHGHWFKISKERFDEIHYTAIAYYKLAVIVFNIAPYLALRIVL
jgi:hypothetical protein